MYLLSSASISHQPTFRNKGYSAHLEDLEDDSVLVSPDYSAFIAPMERRRMSIVLKMAIACAKECMSQIDLKQPDAIIVGTSMGCCTHTKNFMDKINESAGGLISPTSFIQSTHNTIAGQLSLLLGNQSYNMTHTQNSLSFEQALMDAFLGELDGLSTILVGAADEIEPELYNIKAKLGLDEELRAIGASFFILSSEKKNENDLKILDVESNSFFKNLTESVSNFLKQNDFSASEIDAILYSSNKKETISELQKMFGENKLTDFQKFSGNYFTNSGFALDYARDMIENGTLNNSGQTIKTILICNNQVPENLGLILLTRTV